MNINFKAILSSYTLEKMRGGYDLKKFRDKVI